MLLLDLTNVDVIIGLKVKAFDNQRDYKLVSDKAFVSVGALYASSTAICSDVVKFSVSCSVNPSTRSMMAFRSISLLLAKTT